MRKTVEIGGRIIEIVGTSHVAESSREEVRNSIQDVSPDMVAVELDEQRLKSLKGESSWKEIDIAEAVREGKGYLLGLNVFLSVLQRKLSSDYRPGAEMLAAVEEAERTDADLLLADRDINETFARAREELGFMEKLRLSGSIWSRAEQLDEEQILDRDVIDELVEDLGERYPSLKRTFLDERNAYMSEKLLEAEFESAVLVVGAAHVEGVEDALQNDEGYKELSGGGLPVAKILKYGLPVFVLAGLGYGFWKLGFDTGVRASAAWILINSFLSLAGAVAARSHPVTMASSFVAAPLTSLDPALGAGMVASYVEAKFHPPTVGELEEVAEIKSYRELWSNQVGRILLTLLFVTIGSAAATFISAGVVLSIIT